LPAVANRDVASVGPPINRRQRMRPLQMWHPSQTGPNPAQNRRKRNRIYGIAMTQG
jgi:hypothetical protein